MERLNGSAINPYFAAENRHAGMSSALIGTGMDYGYSINHNYTAKNRFAEIPSAPISTSTEADSGMNYGYSINPHFTAKNRFAEMSSASSIGNVSPYPSVSKFASAPYNDSTSYPSLEGTHRVGTQTLMPIPTRNRAERGERLMDDLLRTRQFERSRDDL